MGLNNDIAQELDITAGGSFAYKTTSEGVALLDHILENTSFTEPLPVVQPSSQEEVSIAEPIHSLVTHDESPAEPFLEPEDPEGEEILPLEFPFNIEEDIFYDYGNTTLYPLQKKAPSPFRPSKQSR